MINAIRRFFGYYDRYGLKYSIEHLNRMKPLIPFWPRDKQALYADQATTQNLNKNDKFIREQIASMSSDRWFINGQWNTTAVGNLAYISIYCNNKDIRRHVEDCLRNLHNYVLTEKLNNTIF